MCCSDSPPCPEKGFKFLLRHWDGYVTEGSDPSLSLGSLKKEDWPLFYLE